MDTIGDRRDNAFGVVLGCLLPIGDLGIVGTVEVVATDSIEVVERGNGKSRATQSLIAVGDDEVIW